VNLGRARLWTSADIRLRFLDYFQKQNHAVLPSSPLVPQSSDQSLLFTNAGMVQFKKYFLDPQTAPYKQVTTVQKCMRAGGKHNDLDNVGHTPRHHTFFEMLGNFSFGGYNKEQAITDAWNFLIQELQLPPGRLRVSVLESDQESFDIWHRVIGLPVDRIDRLGTDDNFWAMGHGEGPCGSCTEIFWDTGNTDPDEQWLEIWNLVFMEFQRAADGTLARLPTLCVDTGMGLERIAAVLQKQPSNFDIDTFSHLTKAVEALLSVTLKSQPPTNVEINRTALIRIIADHLRSSSFLLAEGVTPANNGRGYVLRRIIRRATRAGRQLGLQDPFLRTLFPALVRALGAAYPELEARGEFITDQLFREEVLFRQTLDKGIRLLEQVLVDRVNTPQGDKPNQVNAQMAFTLYDTHGFPVDLTCAIAQERGWTVDLEGFQKLSQAQRDLNRATFKGVRGPTTAPYIGEWQQQGLETPFIGYSPDRLTVESTVLAIESLGEGKAAVLLSPNPFYGLGGGQMADQGELLSLNGTSVGRVADVHEIYPGTSVVQIHGSTASSPLPLQVGERVTSQVDAAYRQGLTIHHSATHMLNAAITQVTGQPTVQTGSQVKSDGLRFDFTCDALTSEQIAQIEELVNQIATQALPVTSQHMSLEEAQTQGATATFSEKYGDEVRVIEVGLIPNFSKELCCGTHVANTSQIYPFKILTEGSISAGVRRIEAVAGLSCVHWLQAQATRLQDLANSLRVSPGRLETKLKDL
ncbi:tRNA synthetases class II (A)-domain-containing protein, partial [Dimargaris cristalligena]